MKRKDSIPYIKYSVSLHGCVKNPEELMNKFKEWLTKELEPDYESDIEIEIVESAGLVQKDENFVNLLLRTPAVPEK